MYAPPTTPSTGPCSDPLSCTTAPVHSPSTPLALAITDDRHRPALRSTRIIRGQQCAEALLGRRRSDPAAAGSAARQSRALAGGLNAEPSWLPSVACAAADSKRFAVPAVSWCHEAASGCRPCLGRPVRVRVSVSVHMSSVGPSSVRRPVRVQRPRVRCPVPGVQCPVSVSGVQCERPASSSTLSAPMSPWSTWVRRQPHVPGQAGTGNLLDP
jgi:hypothetical protein